MFLTLGRPRRERIDRTSRTNGESEYDGSETTVNQMFTPVNIKLRTELYFSKVTSFI